MRHNGKCGVSILSIRVFLAFKLSDGSRFFFNLGFILIFGGTNYAIGFSKRKSRQCFQKKDKICLQKLF